MPEAERNRLLRRVDWRFLLHHCELPTVLDWATGELSRAVPHAMAVNGRPDGACADLVVLTRPTPKRLAAARAALRTGGALYCEWRWLRPGGIRRAERVLREAGLAEARLLWPWPPPWLGPPQFWLPLDSSAAVRGFISLRPGSASRLQAVARALWPLAARAGLLAPVCAVAHRPLGGSEARTVADEVDRALSALEPAPAVPEPRAADPARRRPGGSWLLLTGGHRSTSKVVAMSFGPDGEAPEAVVKFARVPEADAALEHEAQVLRLLEAEGGSAPGIPRVLWVGRRVGRVAVVESAIHGVPLISRLTRASFPQLAGSVTSWLTRLVPAGPPSPQSSWEHRLVERPREEFERSFRSVLRTGTIERLRTRLAMLAALPPACEHRDCAPWNVVLAPDGTLGLLDWESAEPRGLAGMDLVYFLTSAAFLLTGAYDSGETRQTYAELLDSTTELGRVFDSCWRRYCASVAIAPDQLPALRLLCWVVHSKSDFALAVEDCGGPPSAEQLRSGVFLGLIEEELQRGV